MIVSVFSALQLPNALLPILDTEAGRVIEPRLTQPENAPFPITVTVSGMLIEPIDEPANDVSAMTVTGTPSTLDGIELAPDSALMTSAWSE